MNIYSYRREYASISDTDLNKLASEGWRLVSTYPHGQSSILIFELLVETIDENDISPEDKKRYKQWINQQTKAFNEK